MGPETYNPHAGKKFNPNKTVFPTGEKSTDPNFAKNAFEKFRQEQLAKPVERPPQGEVIVSNPVINIKRSPEERQRFKQKVVDKLNIKKSEIADILEQIKKL